MSRPPVATRAGWQAIAIFAAFAGGVSVAVLGRVHSLGLCALVAVVGCGAAMCISAVRRTCVLLPLLLGVACAAGLARGELNGGTGAAWIEATHGNPVTLQGTVRDGTGSRRNGAQIVVDVDRVVHNDGDAAVHGRVLATLRTGPAVLPGDRVRLDARSLRPPGDGSAAAILMREDIDAVAQSPALTVLADGGPSPARVLAIVRGHLADAVDAALPEPAASLVDGIVFGIHRPLASDLSAALQDAGLAHILAISGLKVVLVVGLMSALCSVLAASPRQRLVLTGTVVGSYVVLCGATPAAVRSAVMAGVGWGLHGTGRATDPLPLLTATAAAMLAVDPGLVADAGFQLSFLGTLGIMLLANPLADRLPGPRLLREPFALTVAAQVATLPVMASTFGVISLVGPLANALAVPILPALIVPGGIGAGLATLLPAAGAAPLAIAGLLALLIGGIASHASALPLAAVHVAAWPAIFVIAEVVAVLCGGAVFIAMRRHGRTVQVFRSRRATMVAAAIAALCTGASVVVAGSRADGRLHISVLDVGGAEAVAIRTPDGGDALVDTGADPQRLLQSLGPALPPLTRSLGLLVLTGGDRSAVGGLAGLGARYGVEQVVAPAGALGSAARTALSALADHGTNVVAVAPDTSWTWSGVTWALLSPDGTADEGNALTVSDGTGHAVLLGNLTATAQEELAALHAAQLRADLLVTPPAGAVAPGLAAAVRPRLVAVPDARSTHASTTSAGLLSGPGVRRTADSGTLTYTGSEGGLLAT